jgi:uncharacterized membrane protein
MPTLRSVLVVAAVLPFGLSVGCKKDDDDDVGGGTELPGTTTEDETTGPNPTTTTNPSTSTTTPDDDDDTGPPPPGGLQAFRFTSMHIRDPHFYADLPILGCNDITDSVPLGAAASINEQFNDAIGEDGNDDGLLDLSLVLLFDPLDQSDGASGNTEFTVGDCTAPAASTECSQQDGFDPITAAYMVMQTGTCHEADPSHLSSANYTPAPGVTMGPCFHAGPTDISVETESLGLPLQDAEIAATFDGNPAQAFISGTMRGFLTQEAAEQIELPASVQDSLDVMYVSQLLPGGCGPDASGPGSGCNCAGHDDKDGDGWWFYVDFTAELVPWE